MIGHGPKQKQRPSIGPGWVRGSLIPKAEYKAQLAALVSGQTDAPHTHAHRQY